MNNKLKGALVAVGAVGLVAGGGAAIATATGGDDDGRERQIRGAALERASAAALERAGGGRVTDTEVGDEEGFYEVEVTRDDGSQVDVHLDRDFTPLGSVADEDGAGDDEAGGR